MKKMKNKIKKWVSFKLTEWAYRIYPENSKVAEFNNKAYMDLMITGNVITRIDPMQFYKNLEKEK